MELTISIKMNERLYLRNPESSELGKKMVKKALLMVHRLGFEEFTFKKLAKDVGTTEASVYRYFENKQRLLQYLIAWYWSHLEYRFVFHVNNISDPEQKIKKMIDLLLKDAGGLPGDNELDNKLLYQIVVSESNKAYLTKGVTVDNKAQLFKPYKDLCARIALVFLEYSPKYLFPHSLASTLIEASHFQYFFMKNLPSLTDFGSEKDTNELRLYLENLVFSSLNAALRQKK